MTENDRDPETFGKWIALFFTVIGQLPTLATFTGVHPISLYQPAIYHDKEYFLLVPVMVGLFATWCVLRWPKAMWAVLAIFLMLTSVVYYVYDNLGPLSPVHPINWVLSYCVFALCLAALTRLTIDAVSFFRST